MSAAAYLKHAAEQIALMSEDMNRTIHILELRDSIRELQTQIDSHQAALEALPNEGRNAPKAPGYPNGSPTAAAQNLTAKIIRLRSYQIPLQQRVRQLERDQLEVV